MKGCQGRWIKLFQIFGTPMFMIENQKFGTCRKVQESIHFAACFKSADWLMPFGSGMNW
jgi:hypothetical protein